ncbi:MAG: hypothetical protein WC399_03850 [Bacilli bacterium]|jgi:hypothetical protein
MIRIFEADYPEKTKANNRKMALVMAGIFIVTIGVSVPIVLFRHALGSLTAQIMGIILSSLGLIAILEIVVEVIVPSTIKTRLIARLSLHERRLVSGKVLATSPRPEFHLGQPFWKLSLETDAGVLEVYLWFYTQAPHPALDTTIEVSLSENVVMGYAVR